MPGGPRHDQRHQPGQLRVRGPGNDPTGHSHTLTQISCTWMRSQYAHLPPTGTYLQDPQPWPVCDLHPFSFRWRAGNHSAFWGMTLDEGIRYRLGTFRPSSSVSNMNEIHVSPSLPTILPSPHCLGPQEPWHAPSCSSKGLGLTPSNRLCVPGQLTHLLWALGSCP